MIKKFLLWVLAASVMASGMAGGITVNAEENTKATPTVIFKDDFSWATAAGQDAGTVDANKSANEWFSGGYFINNTTAEIANRPNRFLAVTDTIGGNTLKRDYSGGTLSSVAQRLGRTLKDENAINVGTTAKQIYYISWNQYVGKNLGFAEMSGPSDYSFDACMLDIMNRTGAGICRINNTLRPFVSNYYSGTIIYPTVSIEKGNWYKMVMRIEANPSAENDKMSLKVYPIADKFKGDWDGSVEWNGSSTYSTVNYHFRASQTTDGKADLGISDVFGERFSAETDVSALMDAENKVLNAYNNPTNDTCSQAEAALSEISDTSKAYQLLNEELTVAKANIPNTPVLTEVSIEGKMDIACARLYAICRYENETGEAEYQWLKDGVEISGETKAYYDTTIDDIGHDISVTARYNGVSKTSLAVKVSNTNYVLADETTIEKDIKAPSYQNGFATGWKSASGYNIEEANDITNATAVTNNMIEFEGRQANNNTYIRQLSTPIDTNGNKVYYIKWKQKVSTPIANYTSYQRIDFSDNDGSGLNFGFVKPAAQAQYYGYANGESTTDNLWTNDVYNFVVRIDTSGEDLKDNIYYKVYRDNDNIKEPAGWSYSKEGITIAKPYLTNIYLYSHHCSVNTFGGLKIEVYDSSNQYKDLYDVVVKITGAQTKQELENIDLRVINDDNLKKKLSTLIAERTAAILTETAEHDQTKEKIDEAVQAVAALEEGTLKNQLTEKLNLLIQEIAGEYAEQYLQKAEESKKLSDAEQSKLWIDSVSDVALKAALADRYAKLMQFIDSTIPKIGNITIRGDAIIGGTLIAEFTYSENECENDKEPIFKWYRDNVLIAQTKDYTVTVDDFGKTLKAEITPVNNADKVGNAAFVEILIPQNINVCYEDFDYEPGTPVKNIRELNSADALKGFSGGWLINSKADIWSAKQIENEAVVVTDYNTISIPGNSTNYYMRKMQQPIKADGDDCYYISWLMSGFIPASAGTQSQKLEFGTSDGEYTPIMIGMIHQNGADNLIPFIKVNNMGIVYGSESIEPNKIYRFAAMIKMTGDKDAISLKVYPLEGTPKSKWDATISVALNPAVLDRLNFTCNNGDASYNVEYGDLKVQRYSRESMDIFEKLSAELAKAEEEYNEQMLAEVKERLNEMVDGICRSELTERISKLESKIEIEKNTRVKIEQIITALENTDITESKYNEIMEQCKSVEELINLLYSVDSKNNYLSKLNEIYSKLYYVEISKNSITDDFSTYQDGQVLSDDWFLDNELTQSANAIEVVNGCVNLTQNSIFRKIPEVDLNLYTWYMDADYSGDNAEFQIGDMNIKVSNDRISCVLNEESVCETGFKSNGKLILEADNEGMFIRNSEEELYIEWQKEQIIKLGIMKGSVIKKLTCQSVRKEINDDIRNTVSAAQSLQYGDILFAQSRVACLPETIVKFVYSQKTEYLLEENKKLIPRITSISVSGSDYPGGVLKLSYVMEDRGQNKAEPQIEWRYGTQTLSGSDVFKIPSNTAGTVTVTVTPKNLFGIEGIPSSKSINIKRTNVSSGGGGGGGGSVSTPVKNPTVTDKSNAASEYIFLDIANHWAKASIEELYSRGIVKGVENEFFYPDKSVTRAEFAQMISNIIDSEDSGSVYFSDVYENDWYYRAIKKVALCGMMVGNNQEFNPNDEITREEIAVASYRLFRYLNCSSEVGEAIEFADKSEISLWAVDFVDNCSKIRMMSGMDNNCFMPKKTATRAEAATIICRILNCN